MSEGSSALVWRCVHCAKTLPTVLPGTLPNCPFCLHPQQPLQSSATSSSSQILSQQRTQLNLSPQPQPACQSSPQPHPHQPLANGTSSLQQPPATSSSQQPSSCGTSPQQPPSDDTSHPQPSRAEALKEPKHPLQQPTSGNATPKEPDNQMQVPNSQPSLKGSSVSEPKTPSFPPKTPPSHPSNTHPSSQSVATKYNDYHKLSVDLSGQHEKQGKSSEDKHKGIKNLDIDDQQSSTLAQCTTTAPETMTSTTETPKPGAPDDCTCGNSEANKNHRKQTGESDEEISAAKIPKQEQNKEVINEEPIGRAADSNSNEDDLRPHKPPSQHMDDSHTGSAAMTRLALTAPLFVAYSLCGRAPMNEY